MSVQAFHKMVRENFSEASRRYGELCSLQVDIARELAGHLPLEDGARVLDVGCGTGILVAEVARRTGSREVFALDAAERMLHVGRAACANVSWIAGDARVLPFRDLCFDLVMSSSSYQWVEDLPMAFAGVHRVLRKNGRFYAALFGRGTLEELFASMQVAALARGREDVFALRRLPSEELVRSALLRAEFRRCNIVVEKRETSFRDLWSLFKWLQGIGANGAARGFFLGREFLTRVEEHYRENFGTAEGIRVTFEVIWLDAEK